MKEKYITILYVWTPQIYKKNLHVKYEERKTITVYKINKKIK